MISLLLISLSIQLIIINNNEDNNDDNNIIILELSNYTTIK